MRFELTTTGLKHYQELLERRVAAFKVEVADMIFKWQVPPASEDFGDKDQHPYFSGYFRANWQVSINGDSTPVLDDGGLREPRIAGAVPPQMHDASQIAQKFKGDINPNKLREFLGEMTDTDIIKAPIIIYNPTWYGAWLNDGGYNVETVLGNWKEGWQKRSNRGGTTRRYLNTPPRPSPHGGGTDFMRQCMDYMRGQDFGAIAKRIRVEYSQYYRHGG